MVGSGDSENRRIVFGTYAANEDSLRWIRIMVESLRAFGGCLKNAPVWCYHPDRISESVEACKPVDEQYGITFKRSCFPRDASPFPFAGKVFAAALAEADAVCKFPLLVWLDNDVVFVKEPRDFLLPDNISFGYRPVMHMLIGSRFSEPPDEFWSRVYNRLGVAEEKVFPITTPVDREKLRAYFNAGMLVVRPEMGILRKWPESFAVLYSDSVFADWCDAHPLIGIFLHQTALVGAVLTMLRHEEMIELPETYNYPFFMQRQYPPDRRPASLDDVVMFRHEMMFVDDADFEKSPDPSKCYSWFREAVARTRGVRST